MPEHNPLNFCRGCGQDFGSVKLFDRHRIGQHAYTYAEGLKLGVNDGRRCLSVEEMQHRGWELNARERWIDPALVRDARERLRPPNEVPQSPRTRSARSS